jgi:hypothetical protein
MDFPENVQTKYYNNNTGHYVAIFGQNGGAMAHFRGVPVQRGSGVLSDMFTKYAVPLLARAAPHVVKGVSKIIGDVRRGRPLKASATRRGLSTVKRVAKSLLTGKGGRRKGKYKKKPQIKRTKRGRISKKKTAGKKRWKKKGGRKKKKKGSIPFNIFN